MLSGVSVSGLFFGCNHDESLGAAAQALVAECVDPGGAIPEGEWVCGDERVVECTTHRGAYVETIYAQLSEGTCADTSVAVSAEGPFALGTHEIAVTAEAEVAVSLCASELVVVDTVAPVLSDRRPELWPPNHKFHTISVDDCVAVEDACDDEVEVTFTYAASDEPRNDTGDGNTEVDIMNLGCGSVDLLAERKGNGDARVYTLGVRAVDASGNVTEGECHVIVPHDQGGKVPVDSGIAYREEAPACD
ncbi:hypothetical protein BE18_28875 [Sorangium cellulosum]|uniref:Uncharacterized protein n=1 Tax=Sorangium cellulosum TaxID=56 RepID=A0A150RY56_SORCE|nr:hypothetical protein BE18_28875 [Sorangium cellulosum]